MACVCGCGSLLIYVMFDLFFSDILSDISFEPQHQQKDPPVYDTFM
jgi:hypothetical protein